MDLFDHVKQHVNILSYISSDLSASPKKAGGAFRINPCPFCGHNDCFTINEQQQFFRCFGASCGEKGDVIAYEQKRYGISSAKEAAERVADKSGLVVDDRGSGRKGKRKPAQPPPAPPDPRPAPWEDAPEEPAIDPKRASEVRKRAAGFYHAQLLKSKSALKYHTEQRGHSLEVLKRCQVGLATGTGLIKAMKGQGVSIEELAAVGLVRKRGRGWGEYIAKGMTVFPHFSGEACLFFSIKDPAKKKSYQIYKHHAGPGWVCWGQDALASDKTLMIVEGENDRLSVMDKGRYPHVIATIASFNEPAVLKAVQAAAKGRTVYLAFDADPPGKKDEAGEAAGNRYTRKYAAAVLAGGGEARQIRIELTEDGKKQDIDDLLRRAEDPKKLLVDLMTGARAIKTVDPETMDPGAAGGNGKGKKRGKGKARVAAPTDPKAYAFDSFEVLGETGTDAILFWSRVNEKLYKVDLKELKLEKLVQIGGVEVAMRVARSANAARDGQVLFQDLRKRLIVRASKNQLWDEQYAGQGIHAVGDGRRLVVVVGGNAWVWDGKTLTKHTRPIVGDKVIDSKKGWAWVDFKAVEEHLKAMDRAAAYQIVVDLANWIFQWQFRGRSDPWMVLGWVLAQYTQDLWPWRPHIWLAGPAASGKTSLRDLIGTIGGRLTLECEGQTLTEPGLRQAIGSNSCLVLIDEMEHGPNRDAIIRYIRSAGRGGWTHKGSSDQKGTHSQLQHMMFLSSIERGLHRAAEGSRYIQVETVKADGIRLKMPNSQQAEDLRARVVAYALWAAFRAKQLVVELERPPGYDPRFVESLSVPIAMLASSMEKPEKAMVDIMTDYLKDWEQTDSDQDVSDEEMLIKDVLLSHIKVPVHEDGNLRADGTYGPGRIIYPARTLGQLLEDEDLPQEHRRILEAHGVKPMNDGLFLQPEKVGRELLKGSAWEGYQIRELLKRIPGARYGREQRAVRLAGTMARGVLLPWEICPRRESAAPVPYILPGVDVGATPPP